jgi:hypothetical protein
LSSFLVLSSAYGNHFDMSPQGNVGSGNLCELSCCEVEVGSCSICCMLLGLGNSEVHICFDLAVIILHLHQDMVYFHFVALDLAAEAVDFNGGIVQLVY